MKQTKTIDQNDIFSQYGEDDILNSEMMNKLQPVNTENGTQKVLKMKCPELNEEEWKYMNKTIQKKVNKINRKYHKSININMIRKNSADIELMQSESEEFIIDQHLFTEQLQQQTQPEQTVNPQINNEHHQHHHRRRIHRRHRHHIQSCYYIMPYWDFS